MLHLIAQALEKIADAYLGNVWLLIDDSEPLVATVVTRRPIPLGELSHVQSALDRWTMNKIYSSSQ